MMESFEVVIDERGRVTIPAHIRRRLKLKPGRRLRVQLTEAGILLKPVLPKLRKARANRKWSNETFLDAGEATFSEEGLKR